MITNPGAVRSSIRDFLTILFKRKKQIILFFCFSVGTIGLATFLVKPIYEAKAQILVKIGRQNIYNPLNSSSGQYVDFSREDQINTEIEFLKSQSILRKVIERLGPDKIYDIDDSNYSVTESSTTQRTSENEVFEKSYQKLQKALSIFGVKKSDVIEIRFKHKNPEMSAEVINTLISIYLDEHLNIHKLSQSHQFFEEQSKLLKQNLGQAETELETFKKKFNITVLGEQQKLLLQQISNLQVDLNRTLSSEVETQRRIIQITYQLSQTPQQIPQEEEADHNSFLISRLEVTLVELQLEEKDLLSKYTPHNRLVRSVREKIAILEGRLTTQESKLYERSRVGLNTTYQRLKEQLMANEAEKEAISAKKEIQSKQLTEFKTTLGQLNQMEVKLNQLHHTINLNRQNYRLYLAKYEEFRIADAMDAKKLNNVILMDKALPPFKPVSPIILLNLVLAVLIGGLGGVGLAFFSEYFDDSIETPEDVVKLLQLPVLTSIPDIDEKEHRQLMNEQAMRAEMEITI